MIKTRIKLLIYKYIQIFIINTVYLFTKKTNNKIVIGCHEIANNIYSFSSLFKEKTISVNFSKHAFYHANKYDYCVYYGKNRFANLWLKIIYKPFLFAKLACSASVFCYFWDGGFCIEREIDFKFLKKHHKKIICFFMGDDIRSRKVFLEYCNKLEIDTYVSYSCYDYIQRDAVVKSTAKIADKYADMIFSYPIDQMSYLKSKQHRYGYIIEDDYIIDNFKKFENLDEVIIVHAPSDLIVKGTALVRAAIKKIKLEGYKIRYIELHGISNKIILETIRSSHIVLNQFYGFLPGVFGIEAMASCNAVLMSANSDEMPDGTEKAWLKTCYWEVYDNLKYLLDNPEIIEEYARNGRNYVEKYFSIAANRKYFKDLFQKFNIIDLKIDED